MSELTDLLLSTTDPVVALMLIGLWRYIKSMKEGLHDDINRVRGRVARLEGRHITDGGRDVVDVDDD